MNSQKFLNSKPKPVDMSFFTHFKKISSFKDLRSCKPICNFDDHRDSFLAASVEKMLVICYASSLSRPFYISAKPYLSEQNKVAYLYSDKKLGGNIFVIEDFTNYGNKIIQIFKNIYQTIYSEEQNPSEIFTQFGAFLIDHENQLANDLIPMPQLLAEFYQKDLILKNFLPSRIQQSLFLNSLIPHFQHQSLYSEIFFLAQKALNGINNENSQSRKELIFQNFWNFLGICTKDGLMIFPAKRTFDSNKKTQFASIDEQLIMYIASKSNQTFWGQKNQQVNYFINSKPFKLTELTFALLRKCQNNQDGIKIRLKTEFILTGTSFLFFEEFFRSVLQKYTDLYLQQPFDSLTESNLSTTKIQFKKNETKLEFVQTVWLRPRQNLITNFIKTIDFMIILYLVLEEIMINLRESDYIQKIMDQSTEKMRKMIQNELAMKLHNSVRDYLEKFTKLSTKNLSFRGMQ